MCDKQPVRWAEALGRYERKAWFVDDLGSEAGPLFQCSVSKSEITGIWSIFCFIEACPWSRLACAEVGGREKGRKRRRQRMVYNYLFISTEPISCCEPALTKPATSLAMVAWTQRYLKTLVWLCLTGHRKM